MDYLVGREEIENIRTIAINNAAYDRKMKPIRDTQVKERNAAIDTNFQEAIELQAEWVTVEDVDVLRVKNSRFVAVPTTGKKNAKKFDVVDLVSQEFGCQLSSKEVYGWLMKTYKAEIDA